MPGHFEHDAQAAHNQFTLILLLTMALFLSFFTAPLRASESAAREEHDEVQDKEQKDWHEELVVTSHVLHTPNQSLRYKATAGEMVIPPKPGDSPQAMQGRIFFVSYELEGADKGKRPVTFAFNGGPGASSVWLHMGALGPMRVALGPKGEIGQPPVGYENNPMSWLAFTDLVFIDPVGTGYSRAVQEEGKEGEKKSEAKTFWGVQQDVDSMASFVQLWLTRNERWLSPTYLAGESYGGVRVAALSNKLLEDAGVALSGLIFVSPVIDYSTLLGDESNLPYAFLLPSYAATARYHGKLGDVSAILGQEKGDNLEAFEKSVEKWVEDSYVPALFKGDALTDKEREALYVNVAALTGLPLTLVQHHLGRIRPYVFYKELLRDQRKIVGRMDGTVTGEDGDPQSPYPSYDPALDSLIPPFATAFNAYVRQELQYENDIPYEVLNPSVGQQWDWSSGMRQKQGYIMTSDDLAEAMSVNPQMRVWLICGYYDMATPYLAGLYTLRQMHLPSSLREKFQVRLYQGGHMLYTHEQARKKLRNDAADFYGQPDKEL